MRLIEVLRKAETMREEVGAQLDGRLPDPPPKVGRFFDNGDAQLRFSLQQEHRGGGASQRASDDHHIIAGLRRRHDWGITPFQSTRLMWRSVFTTLPSSALTWTSP